MTIERVLETCLYVDDVEAAATWYEDVLGLERYASSPPRHVFFALADQMLLLFDADETDDAGPDDKAPPHGARGPQHVAFAVGSLDGWRSKLEEAGIEITAESDWGGGSSLYFEDPSGNVLELMEKGAWPVW
ncbi:glyoxalase/bleomycin resistance/extradiol dioxygenase family protein [Thermoplasmatales archaeon SW_10_69_26]|nr:MAG: glyoxalase/bleomycin resistance/extradiol dioxygenase family protein [Thermoplasmatales archaeon SW_10_69_26]